jgi:hypothetical protein
MNSSVLGYDLRSLVQRNHLESISIHRKPHALIGEDRKKLMKPLTQTSHQEVSDLSGISSRSSSTSLFKTNSTSTSSNSFQIESETSSCSFGDKKSRYCLTPGEFKWDSSTARSKPPTTDSSRRTRTRISGSSPEIGNRGWEEGTSRFGVGKARLWILWNETKEKSSSLW